MQVLERFFLNFMNFVGITGRPKGRISAANDERRNIKRPRRIVFQDLGEMCCSVSHRSTAISYVPLGTRGVGHSSLCPKPIPVRQRTEGTSGSLKLVLYNLKASLLRFGSPPASRYVFGNMCRP